MALVKMVCSTCGSENVTRDGILEWDFASQAWVMRAELDNTDCEDCGGEASLDEVIVADDEPTNP